jgi:hypothetical protein
MSGSLLGSTRVDFEWEKKPTFDLKRVGDLKRVVISKCQTMAVAIHGIQ